MEISVYSCREDESEYLKKFSEKYQCKLRICKDAPTLENVDLSKGCECISMLTTSMTSDLLQKFYETGVKFISTRSIGYDHIDVSAAKKIGIHIGNVSYSSDSVADYTVMMMLIATRKVKSIIMHSSVQDYSLTGVQGKALNNMTVGVIGTGRIGHTVIQRLSGFGCKILAYDLYESDDVKKYAKYVPLDELFAQSDIITMHMPATKENYHMINHNSISKMKDGVFIINTARGALIDTGDFIDAVECKKIGGAALDVIENETDLYYNDLKCEILKNRELAILKSYANVLVTPHTAFYTDQVVSDMVEHSLLSCILFSQGKENQWQVV